MAGVTITVRKNGPYLVSGAVELRDADGNPYPAKEGTVALCRCGASTKKPFCDGTHSRIGFAAAEAAVAGSEDKPATLLVGDGYNHFEILETLTSPYGVLGRAVLEQMGLGQH